MNAILRFAVVCLILNVATERRMLAQSSRGASIDSLRAKISSALGRRDYGTAFTECNILLKHYKELGNSRGEIEAYEILSLVSHRLGKNNAAIEFKSQELNYRKKILSPEWKLVSCRARIDYLTEFSGLSESEQEELRIADKRLGSISNRGSLVQIDEDLKLLERVLETKSKLLGPRSVACADVHKTIALLFLRKSKFLDAASELSKAIGIFKQVYGTKHPSVSNTYRTLGIVNTSHGNNSEAERCFNEALGIDEEIYGAESLEVARDLNGLGNWLREIGRLKDARVRLTRANQIFGKIMADSPNRKFHSSYIATLNNLALVLLDQGYPNSAIHPMKKAIAIHENLGEKDGRVGCFVYNSLARIYQEIGDKVEANRLFEKSLKSRIEYLGEGSPEHITGLINYGESLRANLKPEKAISCYTEAKRLLESRNNDGEVSSRKYLSWLAIMENNIGLCLVDQKKFDSARAHFLKCKSLDSQVGHHSQTTEHNIAMVAHHKQNYRQAIEIRKGVQVAYGNGSRNSTAVINERWLGLDYICDGQAELGVKTLENALDKAYTTLQYTFCQESQRQQFSTYIDLKTNMDWYIPAAMRANCAHSHIYRSVLGWKGVIYSFQVRLRKLRSNGDPRYDELARTHAAISSLFYRNRIVDDTAMQNLITLAESLEQDLASENYSRSTPTIMEIQSAIPANAVFVDFFVCKVPNHVVGQDKARMKNSERLYAFVVTHDIVRAVDLGPYAPVRQIIRECTGNLTLLDFRMLYSRIWKHFNVDFLQFDYAIVCPDRELGRIPLRPSTSKCFIGIPSVVASSPSVLLKQTAEPVQVGTVSAFHSIKIDEQIERYRGHEIPSSSESNSRILASIRKKHPTVTFTEYMGWKSTGSNLVSALRESDIVLLETHGFSTSNADYLFRRPGDRQIRSSGASLVKYHPEVLTGFLMSPEIEQGEVVDPGVFSSLRILNCDMSSVDLVVLQICRSGSGVILPGEGNNGVQRACQLAGARRILCPLWDVDASVTKAFIERYFEHRYCEDLGPLESLELTQREFRTNKIPDFADTSHPRFWAGWILMGHPGAVASRSHGLNEPIQTPSIDRHVAKDSSILRALILSMVILMIVSCMMYLCIRIGKASNAAFEEPH